MEIWEPKHPGTLWATPGLLRDSMVYQVDSTELANLLLSDVSLDILRNKCVNKGPAHSSLHAKSVDRLLITETWLAFSSVCNRLLV